MGNKDNKYQIKKDIYTYEKCLEIAKRCNSLSEMESVDRSAYEMAYYRFWLQDYTWFKRQAGIPKYNREICYELAKQFTNRADFSRKYHSAYFFALYNDWIYDYTWFEFTIMPKRWWEDYSHCVEESKKYKTVTEFRKKRRSCYLVCRDNGWLEDFIWLSTEKYSENDKIDNIYVYYFEDFNAIYVGRTIHPRRRHNEHKKLKTDTVRVFAEEHNVRFPEMEVIRTNLTVKEGLELEDYYVQYYREQGCNVINKCKTGYYSGSIGSMGKSRWDYDSCLKESKKYKSRKEFQLGSPGAFSMARDNNWLDDYLEWMPLMMKPDGYWDDFEKCAAVAKLYKNRSELHYSENGGAYDAAVRNNWIDILFPNKGPEVFLTYEKCKELANLCSSRGEFKERFVGAYDKSLKMKWLDEFIPHSRNKNLKEYWNDKEKCREESKKYKGRGEFSKMSPTAYLISKNNHWLDEFYGDYLSTASNTIYWSDESCIEEMKKYRNRRELSRKRLSCYNYAKEHNLLEMIYGKAYSRE